MMHKISNSDGKALISLKLHQVQGKSERGFLRGSLETARQSGFPKKTQEFLESRRYRVSVTESHRLQIPALTFIKSM